MRYSLAFAGGGASRRSMGISNSPSKEKAMKKMEHPPQVKCGDCGAELSSLRDIVAYENYYKDYPDIAVVEFTCPKCYRTWVV